MPLYGQGKCTTFLLNPGCPEAEAMAFEGKYESGSWDWVAKQVEEYESSGGTERNTLRDSGLPIIIFTYRGRRTGNVRKSVLIASVGGAPIIRAGTTA
jgi:hypothetical protein